jgi:hypothetical protein
MFYCVPRAFNADRFRTNSCCCDNAENKESPQQQNQTQKNSDREKKRSGISERTIIKGIEKVIDGDELEHRCP